MEDSQKLKLFPSTLKRAALKWFTGLDNQSIRTWNDMKQTFLDRYLDYCKPTNHKDEVFKMVQKEDENLEDLLEIFQYSLKREKMSNLDSENLKALLLKSIRDEWIDILNMMGKGDISQLPLHDIVKLRVHLSRGKSKTEKGPRDPSLIRANKSPTGSVSRAEIGNMLDEFKTDILGRLSEQLDTLKIQNKKKTETDALAIFCPKCRKKHAIRECRLDEKVVETCMIFSENHETKDFPSIPGLKAVFEEDSNSAESLCFVARRPWQGQQTQGFNNPINFQNPPNWNPWQQPWHQSQNPYQSWVQGKENPYGRSAQFYQYPPSFQNQQALQLPNPNPQPMLPFQQNINQLPAQPLPNPKNKNPQNTYMIEGQQFPTYMIVPLNDVQLRSSRVLEKPSIDDQEQDTSKEDSLKVNKGSEEASLKNSNIQKEKEKLTPTTPIVEQHASSSTPPFPERLQIDEGVEKQILLPNYDFLDELKNFCMNIPLLQAIREIHILAKTIKELSLKRPGRKLKDTRRIHLVGKIADIMMGKITMQKYVDLGSPIVKTHINGIEIPNKLIDLGATINIMSRQIMEQLKLPNLLFTPTLLQLADRSIIKPDGVLEDISVSLDSWEYPVNFMILTPKNNLGGHPLILGRPWLATADAFISCRSGDMYISNGNSTKKFNLYPPAKSITEVGDNEWVSDENTIQPIFTISKIGEDSQILNTLENFEISSKYDPTQFQLKSDIGYLSSRQMSLYSMEEFGSSTIEIFPGKTLNINKNLEKSQQEELTKILQKHSTAFAWEYTDIKGIDPKTCIHHIYIEENSRPIRQPQRRMNPNLREIVKEELQKLLNVNFIYPISDSRWVSPLFIVPKKNGKWRVCIDYRELNKATLKDHFPFPFIDQVLDTLAGKKYFSFLDGFSGCNQIQVAPEDQDKTKFTCPWGTFSYRVLPFRLCNAPATFQRAVLGIFSDLIHDCVEVYMDDFTVYGN